MKRMYALFATGLMIPAGLWAQASSGYAMQYAQLVQSMAGGRGGRGAAIMPPRQEKGRPFSATVTSNSTQTFQDGTRVSQTSTMVEYRDAEGRVRTETTEPASTPASSVASEPVKVVLIRDPVAGVNYRLDPASKSAVRMGAAPAAAGGGRSGRAGDNVAPNQDVTYSSSYSTDMLQVWRIGETPARSNSGELTEDLGTANVNGVAARGMRVTTIVPVGAIGNDREFRSTTERWFSPGLNLLVKSVSSDPRFGTTTYELANISLATPDPSLFRVPADYKVAPPLTQNEIEEVRFSGLNHVSEETVRAVIHTKAGDPYNADALRQDFKAVWNLKLFDDVQSKLENGPRGGVLVTFILTERP
jgi:Surface antigen variable number repeat